MSDNRTVAKKIITTAMQTIMVDRPGVHGSAENSFEMIADLWTVYLRHAKRVRGNDTIRGEDVAEMMSMLKKARKIYGNSANEDNDVDDVGYTALSAMIRLPDPEKMDIRGDGGDEFEEKLKREAEKFDKEPPSKPQVPAAKHTNINS